MFIDLWDWNPFISCTMLFKVSPAISNLLKSTEIQACASDPCQNGATCFDHNGGSGFVCLCPAGFEGSNCENGTFRIHCSDVLFSACWILFPWKYCHSKTLWSFASDIACGLIFTDKQRYITYLDYIPISSILKAFRPFIWCLCVPKLISNMLLFLTIQFTICLLFSTQFSVPL